MLDDEVSADKQRDDHRYAQDELERRPQHAHQLHETQSAANVLVVEPLEEADLGFLSRKGPHQARARVVFLRLRRNVREAGLDALEACVNAAAEVLHQDTGQGHGRQRHESEIRADAQHEKQRENAQEDGVGAVHESRAEQHAHRIQIVGHAGHDVAGSVAPVKT